MHKRFVRFIKNIVGSDNSVTKLCAALALNGSKSVVCKNINYIRFKYSINLEDSPFISYDIIVLRGLVLVVVQMKIILMLVIL